MIQKQFIRGIIAFSTNDAGNPQAKKKKSELQPKPDWYVVQKLTQSRL